MSTKRSCHDKPVAFPRSDQGPGLGFVAFSLARISAGGIAIGRNGSVSHGSYALCVSGWHSRIDGRGPTGAVLALRPRRSGGKTQSTAGEAAEGVAPGAPAAPAPAPRVRRTGSS